MTRDRSIPELCEFVPIRSDNMRASISVERCATHRPPQHVSLALVTAAIATMAGGYHRLRPQRAGERRRRLEPDCRHGESVRNGGRVPPVSRPHKCSSAMSTSGCCTWSTRMRAGSGRWRSSPATTRSACGLRDSSRTVQKLTVQAGDSPSLKLALKEVARAPLKPASAATKVLP